MKIRSLKLLPATIGIASVIGVGCSSSSTGSGASSEVAEDDTSAAIALIDGWDQTAVTALDSTLDMPDDGCIKLLIRNKSLNLRNEFRDSNAIHYRIAEATGIAPITGDSSLFNITRPLTRMTSTKLYVVDPMTHAYPYLIPEARDLLTEITRRFRDSLDARGGGDYRPRVTSMLRTSGTIRKLRRVNRASVDSSAHRFGTTFDISYTRFAWDGDDTQPRRTQEDLKNLLGEILGEVRNEGKCYVIFERKPGCFHITARPAGSEPPAPRAD